MNEIGQLKDMFGSVPLAAHPFRVAPFSPQMRLLLPD
jgi:hypothetical protein